MKFSKYPSVLSFAVGLSLLTAVFIMQTTMAAPDDWLSPKLIGQEASGLLASVGQWDGAGQ